MGYVFTQMINSATSTSGLIKSIRVVLIYLICFFYFRSVKETLLTWERKKIQELDLRNEMVSDQISQIKTKSVTYISQMLRGQVSSRARSIENSIFRYSYHLFDVEFVNEGHISDIMKLGYTLPDDGFIEVKFAFAKYQGILILVKTYPISLRAYNLAWQ